MSEVLPSQKSDLLLVLIRAALVGMLVQPETVPTEGSDEFVCPTAFPASVLGASEPELLAEHDQQTMVRVIRKTARNAVHN
jgi:hypothetical protein